MIISEKTLLCETGAFLLRSGVFFQNSYENLSFF